MRIREQISSHLVPLCVVLPSLVACSAETSVAGEGWIAVGAEGAVYISSENAGWESQPTGITRDLLDVAAGDGRFVAVGDYAVLASDDGRTWTEVSDDEMSTATFHSAAFDGDRFIVAGNYISAAPPPNDVAPRVFVDVEAGWDALAAPSGTSSTTLSATSSGLLAATRIDAPELMVRISRYDMDAAAWTSEWTSSAHAVQAFSGGAGRYAAGDCTVFEATDTSWISVYAAGRCEQPRGAAVVEIDGVVVVVTSRYALRFDGAEWTTEDLPSGTWRDVAHRDGVLVMVGATDDDGGQVAVSVDDGATWTVTARVSQPLFAVTQRR